LSKKEEHTHIYGCFPFVEVPEEGLFLRRTQKSKLLSAWKQSSGTNDSDAHLDACQVGHALTKAFNPQQPPDCPKPKSKL
jgi:hypothetical protein